MKNKQNITGQIGRIFVHNNGFLIARIIKSSHKEHSTFSFKGFTPDVVNTTDVIRITSGVFENTDYGMQLEKGHLIKISQTDIGKTEDSPQESPAPKDEKAALKKIVLTQQQIDCIEAAKQGTDVKIKAYAGTGKTATLVEIAKVLPGRGLYLAYNKAIQLDAVQKFPKTVDCKTAHAIAYRYLYSHIHGRVETLNPLTILSYGNIKALPDCQPYELAFLVIKALRLFCNSAADNINLALLSHPDLSIFEENISGLEYIRDKAWEYWQAATQPNSRLPIEHDFYLKWYQLNHPTLDKRYQYILFDECQDANPVITDILLKQSCQKICVGDEHQKIYTWRGAINAYNNFTGKDYYLSRSFRFGTVIAELANVILKLQGEKTPLIGDPNIKSFWQPSKPTLYTNLCRTNVGILLRIIDNIKQKLHVIGGTAEMVNLAKSGFALYQGRKEEIKHNKIRGFKDWAALKKFRQDFEDPDIAFLVTVIERYQDHFGDIIDQVENACYVKEDQADIVFSTIHKAKGREWHNVVLADDFTLFEKTKPIDELLEEYPEEFNLLYVAITRAQYKLHLELTAFRFIKTLQEKLGVNASSN